MRNPRGRIAPLLLLVAASLALGAPAQSQPRPSAPDAAQQADEHFRRGKALLKEGKKREAREAYLAAYRLKQSHDVAGNLGSLELSLGMPRDAAEHLQFAVRHYAPTGTTPEQLEKARQRLAEAKRQVGTVIVSVSVPGAEVLVDGARVGYAPIEGELFVESGRRTIAARLAQHTDAQQVIEAGKGTEHRVALELKPIEVTPPSPAGSAVVPPPAPAGSANVPKADGGPPVALIVAGGVLAAGGLAAGVGLTVAANGKASDAEALRGKLGGGRSACAAATAGDCATLRATLGSQSTLSNAALASFVLGGTFALATAGLGVWAAIGSKETKTGLRIVPVAGAREGGAVVVGIW